jgi:hypothetical protein
VIAILALAVGVFFAGSMFTRATAIGLSGMMGGYGWNTGGNNDYGPGMMGRTGAGSGMMGGRGGEGTGFGMMGGSGGGFGMMARYRNNNTSVTPLTLDEAKIAAESYLATLKNPDLKVSEIMIFNNNAYVVVTETSTGLGAFELLVDPVSQTAYPEFGPNIMWNIKYGGLNHQNMMGGRGGMMGGTGMMGGNGLSNNIPSNVTADMTVTSEKAIQLAQAFLDANLAGATAATDPVHFYGYYTLDFEKNGVVAGMLSVNGYSGQIFLHTWHGTFIQEQAY